MFDIKLQTFNKKLLQFNIKSKKLNKKLSQLNIKHLEFFINNKFINKKLLIYNKKTLAYNNKKSSLIVTNQDFFTQKHKFVKKVKILVNGNSKIRQDISLRGRLAGSCGVRQTLSRVLPTPRGEPRIR